MLTRFVGTFLVVFASILTNLAYGATCLDIFPGATNDNLANKGLEFINVPPFTGADGYLTNPDQVPLGDSHHLSNASQQIITVGSAPTSETTARLYIANGASWNNPRINVGGDPEDLIIIVNGSLAISGGNTEINAIIYATGSISITGKVEINGAVAAEGALSTTPSADIDYDRDAILSADFNGMCDNGVGNVTPILDFHFDECSYTGAVNEVIDSIGNYAGTAMNGLNTADAGQIEKFAQVTDDQHYVDTSVPLPSSYSVSTWFKKPTATTGNDYFVLGAMASGGDLLYLDRSNNWRWGVYDGSNSSNGSYSFASLDDNWHHLALVYNAGQTLLYIDGVQVDSVNRVSAGTLKYIATSYDQVNSSSPQGFRAPLDEFMVFDGVLSAGAIQTLYNNQLAQNNYDGTTRAPVVCQPLLALYKFEQTDFSTQIDDTSGLDNHAENLFGGLSTPDGKYCRGFESESWNDYNGITDAFRSPLDVNDSIGLQGTISFWFQSRIDWDQGQERVLFDASAGSNDTDKYFVFEIQQDGRLKFAFEDSADADFNLIEPLNFNRSADIWYYLTVTWDYVNNSFAIYVDGNLMNEQSRNTNGAMGELLPIVFGDNSSDYVQAGNSNIASPYSSFGNYDEVRIYNRVLSQAEIQADRDDDTGCEKNLIAEWRMDEINWSGASGEVLDQIANFHGQAFNGANTQSSEPARVGNPGTCGYGVFDGVDDYVAIADDAAFDLEEQLTVSAWIYPESLPSSDLMTILSKDENYEFHLTPQGEINWWWQTNSYTSSGANITPGNWYHIAITYQNGQQVIYVNGVDRGARTYSGSLVLNNDPIQIGQDQFHPGRYFHGRIDEVRIYDYALNSGETNAVYQDTHPCTIYIDHFEIDTLDEQGLTCEADNIVIRACADASCSTLNTDEFTVELLVNNTSKGNITFSGGSVTTDYVHTTAGNAGLSLTQAYSCRNSTTSPCYVDFRDAGFVINNALGDGIPHQISGKPSDIGFNARNLYLKAVKTDDATGACVGLFPDGADVPVNLSYTCHSDSSDCSSKLTLTNNGEDKPLTQSTASHSLRFSADSTAYFSLTYPDAGKLILNAQKLVEVEDSQGNKETLNLQTSSNAFVEKPFAFKLDFSADGNASDAYAADHNGSMFKIAGDTFKMTATAVQWVNGQDNNSDGIPDDLTAVTGNAIAKHFDAKSLTTTHTLQLPSSGQPGLLTTEQSNTFANSVVTNDFNFSEVGIIKLNVDISDDDYLGAGNVFGEVENVGRFIPAYFDLAQNDGALQAYCDTNIVLGEFPIDYAYVGQTSATNNKIGAIRYKINQNPSFTITAKARGGNTTENYTDAFMKLVESSITRKTVNQGINTVFAPVADGTKKGALGTKLALTTDLKKVTTLDLKASESLGEVTFSYKNGDNFVYHHESNAETDKFFTDINLTIVSVIDTDGVVAKDADGDIDGGDPSNALDSVLTLNPAAVEVRFGRANLANSYGPETAPLPQELSVEYFKNGNYVLAADDSCSQYNSANVSYGLPNEPGISASDIPAATGNFVEPLDPPDGLTRAIVIRAPAAGNTGRVRVNYNIYDWLKFDWNGDGNFTENPWAIATFGTYRGNDRIIYQREVSR